MGSQGRKAKVSGNAATLKQGITLAVAVVLFGGLLYALGGDDSAEGAEAYNPVDRFSHVHGIALNPDNPRELYVATHDGLLRGVDDGSWSRVGASQDDLMGFSVHPTNGSVLWSSGHPANPSRDHYNLGVQLSRDGGFTWERIALEGVDFHAMGVSPANPDHLWGYAGGKLYRSTNGGHAWDVANPAAPQTHALTPAPDDADTVYAVTPQGILRSVDGGTTWTPFAGLRATALALDPQDPIRMYAATRDGVHRSLDGGATWAPVAVDTNGGTVGYFALHPTDGQTVYAATFESGLYKSTDGGATWATVVAPGARL